MSRDAGAHKKGLPGGAPSRLTLQDGRRLLRVAREALNLYVRSGSAGVPRTGEPHVDQRGVFCTLRDHPTGNLLGCVGCILSAGSLEETVASVAIGSAEDSRFPPLRMEDLASTTLEISILSPLEQVRVTAQERFPSAIQPGLDGLILQCDGAAGLLLPQVWARVPAPEEFLAVLCFKAGLSDPDAWRGAGVKLYRFQVHVFREMTPGGEVEEKHGPWYTEEGDVTEP